MYRLELHCHSAEVSVCSTCPAEQLIALYKAAGYNGIVSTNHINRGTYQAMEEWPWEKKAEHFIRGWEALKAAAGDDFDVLFACEINLTPMAPLTDEQVEHGWQRYVPNDYLIYGATEDWLVKTGDMRYMTMEELSQSARDAGFLIVHAHPFRVGTRVMNPDLYDGYEVFNGNHNHNSHNELAYEWARQNGKIMTSGSDFHKPNDPICSGIATTERIRDNKTLLQVLRSGDYRLIWNGELR
ncbi:MAG: hypothetical protein IK133_08705 [Clostridia bacterium]|nr:hypothetical protein [Clostridia bacterium]MBR5383892.1 hypothetical protein [Clostridia bacterium]